MTSSIILEKKDRVAVITMNRPEKRNALTPEMRQELHRVLKEVDSDKDIRAVILTGTEEVFASGADIQTLKGYSVEDAIASSEQGSRVFLFLEEIGIPVIAAINGWALGGGLELALACDIRICSDNAKLGQPETRIGIIPGYGANIRLPRIIGIARAKEMIYYGEIISARDAEKIGLVSSVVPMEKLMEKAMETVQPLVRGPAAISFAKKGIHAVYGLQVKDAIGDSSRLYGEVYKTSDARGGIQAFLEKRKPNFTGK